MFLRRWQSKKETRASALGIIGADLPAMRFNDGANNREPHAEAVVLRCEKLLEQMVPGFAGDTRAAVSHVYANGAFAVNLRCYSYLPAIARRVMHGVKGVAQQVNEDLLDLDRIAFDLRQIVR